jgi:hypothetical protein
MDGYRQAGWYLPDGVTGPETNPLGDGTVLLLSFGKLLLGAETLVALYRGATSLAQRPLSKSAHHFIIRLATGKRAKVFGWEG